MRFRRIQVVDSHTGGEPTRVVIAGGPPLEAASLAEQVKQFARDHDPLRSAVVNEPRGSDVLVGAWLLEPQDPACAAGVIFFNNVGYLGMCGHGTIGLLVTLGHLGRIQPGVHRIETPVGLIEATWHGGADVSLVNVASYRAVKDLCVDVAGFGAVTGDVAWGGNWFFLARNMHVDVSPASCGELVQLASRIRAAVNAAGHPEVDHVEIFAAPKCGGHARNFVLCPGGAYDRSPCGTGTSAKLACLAADGLLEEGAEWIQESIVGSVFRGSYRWQDQERGLIIPTIRGSAFITAESTLLLDEADPFRWGFHGA